MEWLDGETLCQRLTRGPLSLAESIEVARQLAETLSFTHARGVLHRDLKPSNLFLRDGRIDCVQILDFGIARRLVASRVLTHTGTAIGSPGHMAPEQIRRMRELTQRLVSMYPMPLRSAMKSSKSQLQRSCCAVSSSFPSRTPWSLSRS